MKKKIIAFAVMVMTIMMSVSFIYAADGDSCKLELNVSTKELKAGDTVDVTVKLKDVKTGGTGILAVVGTINYDTNIFETITDNDCKGMNNWTAYVNGANKKITIQGNETKADKDILTIKFKVKSSVTAGSTKISLGNIQVETDNTITVADASTSDIKITATTTPDPTPTPTPTPTPDPGNKDDNNKGDNGNNNNKNDNKNDNTNNNGNNNNGTDNGKNNNTGITINGGSNNNGTTGTTNNSNNSNGTTTTSDKATGTLPKAGAATIIPAIIVIAVIGGVAYNRYSKMKY